MGFKLLESAILGSGLRGVRTRGPKLQGLMVMMTMMIRMMMEQFGITVLRARSDASAEFWKVYTTHGLRGSHVV